MDSDLESWVGDHQPASFQLEIAKFLPTVLFQPSGETLLRSRGTPAGPTTGVQEAQQKILLTIDLNCQVALST
jgi:hypothetical protein